MSHRRCAGGRWSYWHDSCRRLCTAVPRYVLALTSLLVSGRYTMNFDEYGDLTLLAYVAWPVDRIKILDVKRRRRTLSIVAARDPAAMARWFHSLNRKMVLHLLGFDLGSGRGSGGKSVKRGLLGTVSAVFAPLESAQRGGFHLHYTAWVKEMGALRRLTMDPGMRTLVSVQVVDLLDTFVSAEVRGVVDNTPPAVGGPPRKREVGAAPRMLSDAEAAKLDQHAVLRTDPLHGRLLTEMEPVAPPPRLACRRRTHVRWRPNWHLGATSRNVR